MEHALGQKLESRATSAIAFSLNNLLWVRQYLILRKPVAERCQRPRRWRICANWPRYAGTMSLLLGVRIGAGTQIGLARAGPRYARFSRWPVLLSAVLLELIGWRALQDMLNAIPDSNDDFNVF